MDPDGVLGSFANLRGSASEVAAVTPDEPVAFTLLVPLGVSGGPALTSFSPHVTSARDLGSSGSLTKSKCSADEKPTRTFAKY